MSFYVKYMEYRDFDFDGFFYKVTDNDIQRALNKECIDELDYLALLSPEAEKYLEQIITALSRAGFVKSARGAQGGYKLSRPAEEYTVGMILRAIEGSLVPVKCMEDEPNQCPRSSVCVTLDVWKMIDEAISSVVDNITLAELAQKQRERLADLY